MQAANNPSEAARLINKVLVEFGRKLVHVPGQPDRYLEGSARALAFLREHPGVLSRYREAQTGEADRLESLGNDALLVETRLSTPAGLRAAVRQAQRALEAGRFTRAISLLSAIDGHPDRATADPQVLLTIRVLACAGAQQGAEVTRLLDEARGSPDEQTRTLAARLTEAVRGLVPPAEAAVDPLMPSPFGALPQDIVRLWTEPLENSLAARLRSSVDDGGLGGGGLEGGLHSGRLLVSMPTLVGSTLLLNEGYVLRAYDAYSHQPKWYQFMGAPNAPRSDAQAGDLQVVAVAPSRVVALSGHALPTERSGGGRLLCFDLESGTKLWEFSPERLRDQPEFLGLFLYGAPTIVGDTVIVLGRKVTARTETVSTVLGISLEDGTLRFATAAGAAPGIRIAGTRPFTTPAVDAGWVYVSTGAGATLCIDASEGWIRWIRRDSIPVRDTAQETMPWQLGGCCLSSRGLLTLAPGGDEVRLLDTTDGAQLAAMPTGVGTAWGTPRYFLTDRTRTLIYSVGEGLTAFRADDLRTPLWRFDASQFVKGAENEAILAAAGSTGILGRVQSGWLANGRAALIVPLLSKSVVLHGDDGSFVMEIGCRGPANLLARDGVVAAATNDTVEVFMDATRAQRILVDAVAARPGDVDAVIGLVEFALRARDSALLERAAALAPTTLAAIADDSARRERFVGLLIDSARSGLLGRAGSDALFAAIVRSTASSEERAIALLSQGDWLRETGRPLDAAAAWRLLLAEGGGAEAAVETASGAATGVVVESGANAAVSRLEALQRDDPAARGVSAPASGGTFDEIAKAAGTIPGTAAAATLWVEAAKTESTTPTRSRAAGALVAAMDAALKTTDRTVIATTLSAATDMLESMEQPVTLAALFDSAILAGQTAAPAGLGFATLKDALAASPASQWIQGTPLPSGGCDGIAPDAAVQCRLLRGVIAPIESVPGVPTGSEAFLVADRTLICLGPPDLAPRWTVPLLGDIRFLAQGKDHTYVVEQPDRESIDISAIDKSGHPIWRIDDVASALSVGQAPFVRSDCVLLPGRSDIVAVRADGSVAAFNARDGSRSWLTPRTLEQVECANASETLVVVGGTRSGREEQSSHLAAIDRGSGATIAQVRLPNDEPVRWIRVIDAGSVAFGTTRGVGRWQIIGAAPGIRWLSMAPRTRATVDAEPIGDRVVVTDGTGRSGVIDWNTGAVVDGVYQSEQDTPGSGATRRWMRVGDLVVNWSNSIMGLFTIHGVPLGSTALHGARRIDTVLPASCALIAIEQGTGLDEPREFGIGRQVARVLVHRFGWQDGARIMGAPIEVELHDGRLDRMQLVDGWVLLGGPQTTTALPLP